MKYVSWQGELFKFSKAVSPFFFFSVKEQLQMENFTFCTKLKCFIFAGLFYTVQNQNNSSGGGGVHKWKSFYHVRMFIAKLKNYKNLWLFPWKKNLLIYSSYLNNHSVSFVMCCNKFTSPKWRTLTRTQNSNINYV